MRNNKTTRELIDAYVGTRATPASGESILRHVSKKTLAKNDSVRRMINRMVHDGELNCSIVENSKTNKKQKVYTVKYKNNWKWKYTEYPYYAYGLHWC